ncbi:hypothetical protein A3F00_03520 [Candidatus Daviesbacteria bacterium RIFCSPHIGHO2_12_FULL_37_11]|uniref:Uncharacterized protein n=1 Tax=Candidatus Daviesbacteria bacterium RIFCSPHIGHO2_12_FULL_37_11 TaxID=1797777 RepID=A0A1F5KDP2_9BACT|nr:MAG: hypothetical protein A2111_00715 [Candidatus Daviesbacteria bacterium GWA1_38_6]OGE18017.1 MAG: hypothetical protein A2769_01120 [Candidatus Daviesbacteria bacterium RIFCSPHIGHO2_01_FULL_37_27]OGE38711.1 MAG: hypothetical protein A3F00_03520 [Candidatus Daviesbacteria bacterium RIFCSPHIGHO2_12_FULL_37_11]OGE45801.1 MAG: hypothetical protein A3B39_01060 [Candidatus Daviesbacteria bacterium RIFCSPLOWO2_01_FULL_37_10]
MNTEHIRALGNVVEISLQQPPQVDYQEAWLCLAGAIVAAAFSGLCLRQLYRELDEEEAIEKFIQPSSE